MAISYVGGATAFSIDNTDVSVDLTALTGGSDSAAAAGDLVIFAFNIADADNVDLTLVCNTADFTPVTDLFGNGTQDANLAVFYKFMTATPDTAVVGEGSTGGNDTSKLAAAMVFRGVKPVAAGGPFDVAATTATGTTGGLPDPPSIDRSGAAGVWTVIVGANAHTGGAGGVFGAPLNYVTDFLSEGAANDTADGIIGMGYRTNPADPENPGAFSDNVSGTGWCAVTMALAEAASVASGDLDATEAADTAALAGDVLVEGALASTEAGDVAALAGDVLVAGDLAATEAADALAASGTVGDASVSGDLAAAEAADVAALAGTVLVEGALAATEAADAAAADGGVLVAGNAIAQEAPDTAALAGLILILGDLAATEAADTAAFLGPAGSLGEIQYWNGTIWVSAPVQAWLGGAWTVKPLKRWDGVGWTATP